MFGFIILSNVSQRPFVQICGHHFLRFSYVLNVIVVVELQFSRFYTLVGLRFVERL